MLQNFQSSFAAREYWKINFVDGERVDLTRLMAFDGQPDVADELTELLLVVGADRLAGGPTI